MSYVGISRSSGTCLLLFVIYTLFSSLPVVSCVVVPSVACCLLNIPLGHVLKGTGTEEAPQALLTGMIEKCTQTQQVFA